jgi:hypothetical protein
MAIRTATNGSVRCCARAWLRRGTRLFGTKVEANGDTHGTPEGGWGEGVSSPDCGPLHSEYVHVELTHGADNCFSNSGTRTPRYLYRLAVASFL